MKKCMSTPMVDFIPLLQVILSEYFSIFYFHREAFDLFSTRVVSFRTCTNPSLAKPLFVNGKNPSSFLTFCRDTAGELCRNSCFASWILKSHRYGRLLISNNHRFLPFAALRKERLGSINPTARQMFFGATIQLRLVPLSTMLGGRPTVLCVPHIY
jgi:hypothetical protein